MGFVSNLVLAGAKFWAGTLAGSAALVADAFHSLADGAASLAGWIGLTVSRRPADQGHPYGHRRFDTEASRWVGLSLIVTGVLVGYHALRNPAAATGAGLDVALGIALASVLGKELLYRITLRVGRAVKSPAMIASAVDHRSDAIASVAAAVGIGGRLLGVPALDSIAAVFVSVLILLMGLRVYRAATAELLDAGASTGQLAAIRSATEGVDGIVALQDLRARQHAGKLFVDLKIAVNKDLTVEEGHALAQEAKRAVLANVPDIEDVMVHVNPD
ncbi:MAG TPA: cation diffusion facilitator family transporter [Limnochordia bacterium]|nr:cation diffusion facilitator family transporter [Limnochordia bacterium]